jgi:hypothetical protein
MMVSVLPVSTRKSKGPARLMVMGTIIMSATNLNLMVRLLSEARGKVVEAEKDQGEKAPGEAE